MHAPRFAARALVLSALLALTLAPATPAGDNHSLAAAPLGAGADVGQRDRLGQTPLHHAALSGEPKAIVSLLSAGADLNAVDHRGETALHLAARRIKGETLRALVAAGADVNARNSAGQTPLHVLGLDARRDADIAEAIEELAAWLVAHGADPTLADVDGRAAWPHVEEEPSGDRQPSGYPTYDQIVAQLQAREAAFPALARAVNIGPSSTNKNLWAIKITDNPDVQEDEPEFRYISTMHGDEVTGVVMCLNLIDHLLNNYGTDPRVTNLVNEVEIWIMPCMNPYGYTNNTRYNAGGVDLNRNFPEGTLGQPNSTAGRQVETATIMNWAFGQSFVLSANFHGGALVANYPFDNDGMGSVYSPTPYDDLFVYISKKYSQTNLPMWNNPSFQPYGITNGADWYAIDGGLQDWSYRYMGCNDITIEISNTKSPAYTQMPTFWNDNRESMLAYMEQCLIGVRGIVTGEDTGLPLAATVSIVGRNHNIFTDPDVGDYHRMVLPGSYQVRFEAAGYDTVVRPVTVLEGAATRLDIALPRPAAMLSPNGGESLPVSQPAAIAWTGSAAAQFHVQYTANFGDVTAVSEGFEGGSLPSAFSTGGGAPWYVATGTAHGGTRAARAGAIGNNSISWMQRTVSGGTISFWYKVSSESNYDWFNFYIDGVRQVHRSGEVTWTLFSANLAAGDHLLRWEYTKDGSLTGGSDTAWVDDVQLVGDNTQWQDIVPLTATGQTTVNWTPPAPGESYKVRVRAYYGPGSYGLWDESDATFNVVDGPAICAGDVNCDGAVTFDDIDFFVAALSGEQAWIDLHTAVFGTAPACAYASADCNGDSAVTFDDIDPFVALIGTSCP